MNKRVLQILNGDTFKHRGQNMRFVNLDNIDISEFKKNGVILDTHNDKSTSAILGTVLKMTKTKDGRLYIKDIKWSPSAKKQEIDYNEGILKAASVKIVDAKQRISSDGTVEILSGVLKEVSLCPIGAIPSAVSEIGDIEGIDYQFSYANINKDENMDMENEVKEEVLDTDINLSINSEDEVTENTIELSQDIIDRDNEIQTLKLQLSDSENGLNEIKLQLSEKDNEIQKLKDELQNIKKQGENNILSSMIELKFTDKIDEVKELYFSMDFELAKKALELLPNSKSIDIKLSDFREETISTDEKDYAWYIKNNKMNEFLELDDITKDMLRTEYNIKKNRK